MYMSLKGTNVVFTAIRTFRIPTHTYTQIPEETFTFCVRLPIIYPLAQNKVIRRRDVFFAFLYRIVFFNNAGYVIIPTRNVHVNIILMDQTREPSIIMAYRHIFISLFSSPSQLFPFTRKLLYLPNKNEKNKY